MCDEIRSWPEMRSAVTKLQLDVLLFLCVCGLVGSSYVGLMHFIQNWWIYDIGLQKAAICHFENRPVEGISFGCLFQPPPCVYAGSHIRLCTRMLVCISKHWPPCVWVCAPASVYCWTAKAILTIKRRATSWASTYPAFPSLLMSACCVAYSQWQAAYCWKSGEAKCSLPTKRGHLKSTVSPLCFRFVLLGCRRIGGKFWCPVISCFSSDFLYQFILNDFDISKSWYGT